MQAHFMIRCKQSTYFIDVPGDSCVLDLKKKLAPIIKRQTDDIALYQVTEAYDSNTRQTTVTPTKKLSDESILCDLGLTVNSDCYNPVTLAMALRAEGGAGEFGRPVVNPLSALPELPEPMKPQAPEPMPTHSLVVGGERAHVGGEGCPHVVGDEHAHVSYDQEFGSEMLRDYLEHLMNPEPGEVQYLNL